MICLFLSTTHAHSHFFLFYYTVENATREICQPGTNIYWIIDYSSDSPSGPTNYACLLPDNFYSLYVLSGTVRYTQEMLTYFHGNTAGVDADVQIVSVGKVVVTA